MSLERKALPRARGVRRMFALLARLGLGAGLLFVFVSGSLLSFVLYANLPAGRRAISLGLERVLKSSFEGDFSIAAVEHVSLHDLQARGITVRDPDGHVVLSLSTLSAQLDLPDMLGKLLFEKGVVNLRFDHARVERAEVYLLPGSNNVPTIVDAFTPTPSPPGSKSSPGPTLKIWLPEIEVGHLYGRVALDGIPTLETELSSVRGAVVGSAELTSVDVERFSGTVRGLAGADATGVGSVHVRAPGAVWSSFDGYFGELQFGTVVRFDSPKLDVTLDVPRAEPKAVRALWAGYPLLMNVGAHVEAVGTLQKLNTQAKLLIGQGFISGRGELRFSEHPGADLDLSARSMDLRAIWPSAPNTDLDADTSLDLFQSGDQWVASVNGTTRATQIQGIPVPPIDIAGSYDAKGFVGRALAHEPGIPLKATFDVRPDGSVDGNVEAKGVDLRRAPRLRPYFAGQGLLDVQLKAHIDQGRLSGQLSGDLKQFQYGAVSVEQNRFSGRVAGPLSNPQKFSVDLTLASRRFSAGAFRFDELSTQLRGPLTRPVVSTKISNKRGPQISAKATILPSHATRIENLELEVRRDQAALSARVSEVDVNAGQLRVAGLHMDGAGGKLEATGQFGPERVALAAQGSELDLGVIAHALGLPRGLLGGKVALTADLESAGKTQRGSFDVRLENGESEGVAIESLTLSGKLNGSRLDLQSTAKLPNFGVFSGDAKATLSGSLAEPRTFEQATGILTVKAEHVPFALLSYVLPKAAGVSEVRGEGSATLVLDRASPDAVPNLSLVANTSGLHVGLTQTRANAAPLAFDGVDAHAGLNMNGLSGVTDLVLKLDDFHGPLASATTHLTIDLGSAREHPEQLWSQLRETPVIAKVLIEDRALQDLPAPLVPRGILGRLRSELSLRGTLNHPVFSDKTELYRVRLGESERDQAFDLCAQLDYDKSSGQYGARAEAFLPKTKDDAHACQGARFARFSAGGRAEWDKLLNPALSAGPAWTGTAGLSLEGVPLDIVPAMAEAGFGGRVLGVVMFDRREALPQVRSQLEVQDAVFARTRLGSAKLQAHTDGRSLSAELDLQQPLSGPASKSPIGGLLHAEVLSALDWQGVLPNIDDTRPVSAKLQATNVDAVLLTPFVRDILSEIGGKLDAALALTLTPNLEPKADEHWSGNVQGSLGMRDGSLQLSQLGLRLRNVQLRATAEGSGKSTVVAISSLKGAAEGSVTNVVASGSLTFNGLQVVSGNANAGVYGVPFLVEGVPWATLDSGKKREKQIEISLERRPNEMFVRLIIPELEAKLPQAASRSVIALDKNEDIIIAQPISEPTRGVSGQSLPWRMHFELGSNVKITRADLSLPIAGSPEILLGESLQVQGNVELRSGGRLSLPGIARPFTIENGTVSFDADGDPKDPRVRVRAVCKLSQLTVWVTVNGTFQDAKITFESNDSTLTNQAQILAALLGPTDGANAGLSAGTGYLGQRLLANTALSRLELKAGNETTVDQRTYATYSAAYPISDEFWFEGSYKTLQTQDFTGAGRTAFSGTVDWRFKKNWSLTTELSNIGAGVNLLWLYRY